eukprot:518549_1
MSNPPNLKKRKLNDDCDNVQPLDAEQHRNNAIDSSCIIKLNIGGVNFMTTKQTLLNVKDSYFTARFGGKFAMGPQLQDGSYFIDRDGTHFRLILNFLRDTQVLLPNNRSQLQELKVECKFYNLESLNKSIDRKLKLMKYDLPPLEQIAREIGNICFDTPDIPDISGIERNLERIADGFSGGWISVGIRDK